MDQRESPSGAKMQCLLSEKPLISFGVLTDVQYADRDDAQSWYRPEITRYYRSSLNHIRKAYRHWGQKEHPVDCVIQLGDLLDASNRTMNLDPVDAIRKALAVFDEFPQILTFHVMGNHELDTFLRPTLYSHLDFTKNVQITIPSDEQRFDENEVPLAFYTFSLSPEVVFVVLDCFDVCILGYESGNPKYVRAEKLLKQFHTSSDKAMWDYDNHLEGSNKRFVGYNGSIGEKQLSWLDEQLFKASEKGQKVIVCGHVAILPEGSSFSCVIWNYEQVLRVLHRYNCVVAYLAGHLHDTAYAVDSHGIHHVTFAGIIEVKPEDSSFSTINVFKDRLDIIGYGRENSYTLPFKSEELLKSHVEISVIPSPESAIVPNPSVEIVVEC